MNKKEKRIIEIERIIKEDMRSLEMKLLNEKYKLEYEYYALNNRDEAIHSRIGEIENYLESEHIEIINKLEMESYELQMAIEKGEM